MLKRYKIETRNSRSKLVGKLDRVFSEYIRLRDSFVTQSGLYFKCISCGRIKPYSEADCGHYINRSHMSTRYSQMNCNAQCRSCNRFDEGNIYEYRKALVAKYGESRILLLESRKHEIVKISDFELKAMIEDYKQRVKELKAVKKWKSI